MDILQPGFRRATGVLEGKTRSFNFCMVQITAPPRPSPGGKVDPVGPNRTTKRLKGLVENPGNSNGLGALYCHQRSGNLFVHDEHRRQTTQHPHNYAGNGNLRASSQILSLVADAQLIL